MTIISDRTPAFYKTIRLGVQRVETDVIATLDIRLLNASGGQVGIVNHSMVLTAQQKQQLAAFVDGAEADFESGDGAGLTEWTG
jgi:hypothetical protein